MNRTIVMTGSAGLLALLALAAPASASASCQDRKVTGTVLGGIGGALIGNSISRGGGGAVVGGLGGAVLGHEIAGSGCNRYRSSAYYGSSPRYRSNYRSYRGGAGPDRPRAVRYVYYDQYGNPVAQGPAPDPGAYGTTPYGYAGTPACRMQMQDYYDDRGALVSRPVRICAR